MNDVLRETKDGIPNLADLAQVLMQEMDGFVLLFDAKGKTRDFFMLMQIISIRFIRE